MNHQGHQAHEAVGEAADAAGRAIVDAALKVHRALGPGLLESAYELCLAHELRSRSLIVSRQVPQPIDFDGVRIESGYRLDLLVNDLVIVEIKAVEALAPLHEAQLLTYLRLSGLRLGFLINFNVKLLKQGLRRLAL